MEMRLWLPRIALSLVAIAGLVLVIGNGLLSAQPVARYQNILFQGAVILATVIAAARFWLHWRHRSRMAEYVAMRLIAWESLRRHGAGTYVTLRATGNALSFTAVLMIASLLFGFGVIAPDDSMSRVLERIVKVAAVCAVPSVLWAIEEWRQWEKRYSEFSE